MRVVSENSAEELEAKRREQAAQDALAKVNWKLKDLAANMLRVVRGAGKPWDVGAQSQALVEAMIAYRDLTGFWLSSEQISAALCIDPEEHLLDRLNDENRERVRLEHTMLRGALQKVASDLLDQGTQAAMGHRELFDGVIGWHRLNEEVNAQLKRPQGKKHRPIKL